MAAAAKRARVYFDVQIGARPPARVEFELFSDILPRTCENFRALCTGEMGGNLTYAGSAFHRVIRNFMIQGGDFTRGDGTGGSSIYGSKFEDEGFQFKHTCGHLLSMANAGPHTNGSQFFVTLRPTPHLDGKHVVFGRVVSGAATVDAVGNAKVDDGDRPLARVAIVACGELGKASAPAEAATAAEAAAAPAAEPEEAEEEDEDEDEDEAEDEAQFEGKSELEKRLLRLRMQMNKGRRANAAATKAERKKKKEDRDGKVARRADRAADKQAWKDDLAKRGVPEDKAYLLETADFAGRREDAKRKKEKRKAAFGWDVFNEDSKHKAYEKRTEALPVSADWEEPVADLDPLTYGAAGFDDPKAVARMADELEQRAQKRSEFSRRRTELPGADVDSINDRNKHFNKKLKRAFDKYTVEIRQNLERGTAI